MAENQNTQGPKEPKKSQFNQFRISGNIGAAPKLCKKNKEFYVFPMPVESTYTDGKTRWMDVQVFSEDQMKKLVGVEKGAYVKILNSKLQFDSYTPQGGDRETLSPYLIAYEIEVLLSTTDEK